MYSGDNYVVLDFEVDTSHGDYGHAVHPDNKLLLSCWKHGDSDTVLSSWRNELYQDKLLADIEAADFLVAHNAKYELGWLKRCGLDLSSVLVFDTKIAEYVLLGNLAAGDKVLPPRSTSLNACAKRRGLQGKDPAVDIMMSHGHNPTTMPSQWLLGRCVRDVRETEKVFLSQRKQLEESNRLPVLYTRCLLTPFLAETEFTGMSLDPKRVDKQRDRLVKRKAELATRLEEITGGINWNSKPQLAEFLYEDLGFKELRKRGGEPDRTPVGRPKTDKATLTRLKAETPEQKELISLLTESNKVSSDLSKTIEFFDGVCAEQDGIFHAEFNQTRTATHRLSSSGMRTQFKKYKSPKSAQFQNLPNEYKSLFNARKEGWLVAEADGSQLEFRVAAQLSGDERAVEDILSPGFDAHRYSASIIYKVPEDEVTPLQRKRAKTHTFKPLYGGRSGTPAERRYYEEFKKRYSQLNKWQEKNVYSVLNEKKLTTPWGLRFYWPYASMSRSGYINVTTSVYNYPIQAFATAEIIPIAVRAFWDRLRTSGEEDKIVPVNTVHDSLICEVHPEAVEKFREVSLGAFTEDVYAYLQDVYSYDFDLVPLGVGINIGSHWADKGNVEEEYNVFQNGRREAA